MDPRDAETAKWLGNVIDAGESSHYLPASNLTHDQVTATSAAAIASEGKAGNAVKASQTTIIARNAAVEATNEGQVAPPIIGQSRSKSSGLVASGGLHPSSSSGSRLIL